MISRVEPADLAAIWDQVEPLVVSAMYDTPTHSVEDVRNIILNGDALLLVQTSDQIDAIVLVEIVTYPQGKWVSCWMIAARKEATFDTDAALATLEVLREANGCRGIQSLSSRIGWFRKIKGVKLEGYTMRLTKE